MQEWPHRWGHSFSCGSVRASSIAPALGPRYAHAIAPLLGGDGAAVATSFGLDHDAGRRRGWSITTSGARGPTRTSTCASWVGSALAAPANNGAAVSTTAAVAIASTIL